MRCSIVPNGRLQSAVLEGAGEKRRPGIPEDFRLAKTLPHRVKKTVRVFDALKAPKSFDFGAFFTAASIEFANGMPGLGGSRHGMQK